MSELKKRAYAVYLCGNTANPPKQHIFWVDDIWFHGVSMEGGKPVAKRCHFAGAGTSIDASISGDSTLAWNSKEYTLSHDLNPKWNPLYPFPVHRSEFTTMGASPSEGEYRGESHSDTDTQKDPGLTEDELIPVIAQFAMDNDYGIVLCSFEYFLLHREDIAQHAEHAAIFDVRHQAAAGKSDLIDEWTIALGSPSVVKDFLNVCGYRLYLEFAKCCLGQENRFSLERHACFLTSKDGFHGDYLAELLSMTASHGNLKTVHLLRPLVLSKSKTGGVAALDLSLELFNSSFRNALSWEAKESALWKDMKMLWGNPRTNEDWGHVQAEKLTEVALKSTVWLPLADRERAQCLQAMYLAKWRTGDGNAMAVKAFQNFLDHAADSGTVTFNKLNDDLTNTFLSLPSRPGVLSVLAIARFLRSLAQLKADYATPDVSWDRDADIVKLMIKLPSKANNVADLKKKFLANASTANSVSALRDVVVAQLQMLDRTTPKDASTKLGDIAHNGTALRDKLCDEPDHEHLPLPKTLPSFKGDTITFWFQRVVSPKQ